MSIQVTTSVSLTSYGLMSSEPDQKYITDTLNGDTRAFSVLVDRYKDLVYTLAYRILKHREEAEEVAQDTFVKVYTSMSQFKGKAKFSTWVYKIAYYGSLDALKKRQKNRETGDLETSKAYWAAEEDYGGQQLDILEHRRQIKNAIQQLPASDSLIITLFYYEELSLDEISKIMDIPASALKVRLFRSRKKLSEILKSFMHQEKNEIYGKE